MTQPVRPLNQPADQSIPPELAAYYPAQTVQTQPPPPPLQPIEPATREHLNLRLGFLIAAWIAVPLVVVVMILINLLVATPEKVTVNQMAKANAWQITAETVARPVKTIQWTNFGNQVAATGNWLIVPVTIKNTANTPLELTTDSFELSDSKGTLYQFSDRLETYAYVSFKGGQNLNVAIPANTTVHSFLVYDVPTGASGFQLKFKQANAPVIDLGI